MLGNCTAEDFVWFYEIRFFFSIHMQKQHYCIYKLVTAKFSIKMGATLAYFI